MRGKLLYFIGGVIVGSVGAYIALRERFKKDLQTEIDQVKEAYGRSQKAKEDDIRDEIIEKAKAVKNTKTKEAIANKELYKQYIKEAKQYNLFSNPPKAKDIHNGIAEGEDLEIFSKEYEEQIESTPPPDGLMLPYVLETDDISTAAEKFVNENPYFDKVTLFYYDDGVLSSEEGEDIIEDIDAVIGEGSLERIGEFEEDVVYVRNERRGTDYEVIHQHRPFAILPEDID